jgi:ATP-dependent DNA ligase
VFSAPPSASLTRPCRTFTTTGPSTAPIYTTPSPASGDGVVTFTVEPATPTALECGVATVERAMFDVEPMLVRTGRPERPADGWCEPKLDGWRARLVVDTDGRWLLRSRNGAGLPASWLVRVAAELPPGSLLDGEVIAAGGRCEDFYAVPTALSRGEDVGFVAFDACAVGGQMLCDLPLTQRRERLEGLAESSALAVVPRFDGADYDAVLAALDADGYEGLVWKHPASRYQPGARSRRWLKTKTSSWATHAQRRRLVFNARR